MRTTIHEPGREIPVLGEWDVLIAGGGMAGVAAALAASRGGARGLLLEKTCALGGLATLGNVTVWLPLCDGKGRQVSGGLAEELLQLSVSDLRNDNKLARFIGVPACWSAGGDQQERARQRYLAHFNPSAYWMALEALVVENGVEILYDTRVCAVLRSAEAITHLVVENKSGRSALAGQFVVDATGDADVCFLAGEETEALDSNVLCGWYYHLDQAGLHLHPMTRPYSPYARQEHATGPFFRGDDAEQVTAHVLQSRALMRRQMEDLRRENPESDLQIIQPPTIPTFRMTRRLVGEFSLGERHMHQWFDDTLGLTSDWRKPGPVYALPFRALRGVRNRNLVTAGRCISADTTAWDVTRAIPGCVVTGQAAGAAAALCVQRKSKTLHDLDILALQQFLRSQGALLSPELVTPV